KSNNSLCLSCLLSSHLAPVINVSAVLTLSLTLAMVSIILSLSGIDSLIPAILGDLKFYLFIKIC
ncbi:hypothetical protein P170DRAFT_361569, partial [Aspergillus steynii IBT 23096]